MESSNKENTNEESYTSSQDTLTSLKVIKQVFKNGPSKTC